MLDFDRLNQLLGTPELLARARDYDDLAQGLHPTAEAGQTEDGQRGESTRVAESGR